MGLLQIGISNVPDRRLSGHSSRGWQVLDLRGPMDGYAAYQLEQAALKAIIQAGATTADALNLQPFSGYTESWLKSSYPVRSLKEILELVHQMEWNEIENH